MTAYYNENNPDAAAWLRNLMDEGRKSVDTPASLCYAWGRGENMAAHRKDYDDAVRMYQAGLSIGDVAKGYGITRQAMYTILKRRGVQFRSKLRFKKDNHFWRGGTARTPTG